MDISIVNKCLMYCKDNIIAILSLAVSIISIIFSFWSWNQNKIISLKNEFIKRETQILLEYREVFLKAQLSFNWFKEWILLPIVFTHYIQEPVTASRDEYYYHFNNINKLNDIYNLNQHILEKHGLNEECKMIAKLLQHLQGHYFEDIPLIKQSRNDNKWEFRLYNYNDKVQKFLEIFKSQKYDNFIFEKFYPLYEKEVNILYELLANLEFKLDNITLYHTALTKKHRNFSKKIFFPYHKINEVERFYSETLINKK